MMNGGLKHRRGLRYIAGAVLAVAVMGAAMFFYWAKVATQPPATPPSGQKGGDSISDRSGQAVARYSWAPGTMQRYRLSLDSDINLALGSPGPQKIVQKISGTLNMRVFEREGGLIRIGFQLYPVAVTVNHERDERFEERVSSPFTALYEERGRPRSFQFPPALNKEERMMLEEVLRTFQAVLPEKAQSSWTAAEDHATGKYLAYYRLRKDGRLQKQKTLYTEVTIPSWGGAASGEPKVRLKKTRSLFRLSPETAWLHSAEVHERLAVHAGTGPLTETDMNAGLEFISSGPEPEVALFGEGSWEQVLLSSFGKPDSEGKTEEISGKGPEASLAALVGEVNKGQRDRISSLNALQQMLLDHPELAFTLVEYLRMPGTLNDTETLIIHSLERAGTLEAQEALVMVLNDPSSSSNNRIRAAIALGGVEAATGEAVTALLNTSRNRGSAKTEDLANTALLAVGSVGRTLAGSHPDRARWVKDELTASLEGSSDPQEAGMALKAMGNMGDPDLKKTITRYVNHESSFVRASAAQTLGRLRAEETLPLLTDQLSAENNASVRSAIAAAMENIGNPTNKSLEMVNRMVLKEPDSKARYHMARYIGDNVDIYPEGINTLKSLVITDRSDQVRKYAATVLFKMRQQAGSGRE